MKSLWAWPRIAAIAVALATGPVAQAAEPVPTVIVDIHGIGAARLAALKADPSVRWSAEFGNELLLGIAAQQQADWLARPGVRTGVGRLAREEIWVRDHVCAHQAQQPAVGVVGGYELVRMPAGAVRYAQFSGVAGSALPDDGVQAREAGNHASGKLRAGVLDPAVARAVSRVDAQRWFDTMAELALFNRNSFSPELDDAHDWISQRLAQTGVVTSSFSFTLENLSNCGTPAPPPIQLRNPIGEKRGATLPDEWVVVGAHYDSRNVVRCDGVAAPQPGANDNASGCAGVIELARAFAQIETHRSILFMCFSGEEQGLFGSRRYVEALQESGDISKVVHMMNLDMLGFDAGGALDARVETTAAHTALLSEYAAAAAAYAPELNLILSSNTSAGSDHWFFLSAGVPSVFTWENGASNYYPHYHKSTDVPANMTNAIPLAGGILKMDAAMLAQKAGLSILHTDGFEDQASAGSLR